MARSSLVALGALLAALTLSPAPASAATYRSASHGYTVTLDSATKMGTLRIPKREVVDGQGPLWTLYCGKSKRSRKLMFSIGDFSGGKRTFQWIPLAGNPAKRRSCKLVKQAYDGSGDRVASFRLRRR